MSDEEGFDELSYLRQEVRRLRNIVSKLTPSIDVLLKRRGFRVYKKNPDDDLFIPREEFLDDYYIMLHKYSFRLFLRDVIKHQKFFTVDKVKKYATYDVTKRYIEYLLSVGLCQREGDGFSLLKQPVKSFGETLEWYVAEILRREFCAEVIWGVKFKRPVIGGDYDVIAKMDSSLLYAEVKSSPPKQIYNREVAAFLGRVGDLVPDVAIFLMDTRLRMKDKIVPMFEEELGKGSECPPAVERIEKELFQIQGKIFIINSKDSILNNIERVLNWYYRKI